MEHRMETVAKVLGVGINEEFQVRDNLRHRELLGARYKLTYYGLRYYEPRKGYWVPDAEMLMGLLTGEDSIVSCDFKEK